MDALRYMEKRCCGIWAGMETDGRELFATLWRDAVLPRCNHANTMAASGTIYNDRQPL